MAAFAHRGISVYYEYGEFHVKCGTKIVFSNNRGTAHGNDTRCVGIVYSAKPIPKGEVFQVKVQERVSFYIRFSPIGIGFTRLDPDNIDHVPEIVGDCWKSKDYWMFCDSTAHHDGTEQDMSFSTNDLFKGDSVGVQVSENGDVQYYVNGKNKGRVFQHLPQHQDLWGVVLLCGDTKIQSEFHFDTTSERRLKKLEQRVSHLELAEEENKPDGSSQSSSWEQVVTHEVLRLRQDLATQQQENKQLGSRVKRLTTQLHQQQEELTLQFHQQQELTAQLHQQQEELTTQLQMQLEELTAHFQQQLTDQQQENKQLFVSFESLTRAHAALQHQNQQLTTQLEMQHEDMTTFFTQRREIHEEMQQQFQALLQQVQSLQPSWSIAQHHLQITAQVLGRGAWGEVRVGIYQGTRVAVKKMHDVIISNHNHELFEREMVVASRVRHPHLVLFIGAVTTGNLTIVSELMETSLRKLLEEEKLQVSDLRPISKDVACALAYLHSLPDPIVHRDVSSANVLLNAKQDGWCSKLGDFGSANFLAKLGTVGPGCMNYSAPEAGNPSQQGPKMDVYSFGVLLFEMCVGNLVGQHNLQTTRAAVAYWTICEKKFLGEFALGCTETNPDNRPNMVDFVRVSVVSSV